VFPLHEVIFIDMKVIKRFYRDKKNASLFGVCAGLERYTDIDRVIWRIIFLALFFFPFPSFLFYLGITLLTPSRNEEI